MKKLTALFVNVLVLCFSLTFDASAKEYKIGDKMPDHTQDTSLADQQYGGLDVGVECDIYVQLWVRDGNPTFQAALHSIGPKIIPFGIFDIENKMLFLDNKDANGINGPDGLIDEIVKNPTGNRGAEDHPYFKKLHSFTASHRD